MFLQQYEIYFIRNKMVHCLIWCVPVPPPSRPAKDKIIFVLGVKQAIAPGEKCVYSFAYSNSRQHYRTWPSAYMDKPTKELLLSVPFLFYF